MSLKQENKFKEILGNIEYYILDRLDFYEDVKNKELIKELRGIRDFIRNQKEIYKND